MPVAGDGKWVYLLRMSIAQRSCCCKRHFKLKIIDILELNLDFRKWCHPISFDSTRPFGKLGFKLIDCSCRGVYTSNPDLRFSTCVKIGDGKKEQDGKTKNIFSQSFHFGFLPKISHNELDLNNRSWRTPEWLGSLPKLSVPQEERFRFLPTHSVYMVRMILCAKAGFIIQGESGISRLWSCQH